MNYVHIVAVVAVFQFFFFGIVVGRARGLYGVAAPATSGHELFERAYRIQMNTLEQLVCFLPALLLAEVYWSNFFVAAVGTVYILGRFMYAAAYAKEPSKRAPGFLLTILPTFVLLGATLVGAIIRNA